MKYHIDTIPVWDALKAGTECPLCALRRRTERLLIRRSLGAAVMSPDTRKKVNERGFCPSHQAMLYTAPEGNRLGHALMMLSHLQTQKDSILSRPFGDDAGSLPRGAFLQALIKPGMGKDGPRAGRGTASCLICDELRELSQRQTASLVHLYKTDAAFRGSFRESRGLCVPHCEEASAMAGELLSGGMKAEFTGVLKNRLSESLERLQAELERYTRKFDYRNADEPWGDARDALERTINKLQGWCLGNEPLQED